MKTKYIQSAIDRFSEIREKDYLINPISRVDADIIQILLFFIQKAKMDDIISIMKDYKYESDKDILSNLSTVYSNLSNVNVNAPIDEKKEDKNPVDIIIINNERIPRWAVRGYKFDKYFNFERGEISWALTLNPENVGDIKSVLQYTNKKFYFSSRSELMYAVIKLDKFIGLDERDAYEELENDDI